MPDRRERRVVLLKSWRINCISYAVREYNMVTAECGAQIDIFVIRQNLGYLCVFHSATVLHLAVFLMKVPLHFSKR